MAFLNVGKELLCGGESKIKDSKICGTLYFDACRKEIARLRLCFCKLINRQRAIEKCDNNGNQQTCPNVCEWMQRYECAIVETR